MNDTTENHKVLSEYKADSDAGTAYVMFDETEKNYLLMVSYHGKNADKKAIIESAVIKEVESETEADTQAEDFVNKVDAMELV